VGLEDKAHLSPANTADVYPSGPTVFLKERLAVKRETRLGDFSGNSSNAAATLQFDLV
jgi:hypothetical protein